MRKTFLLVIIVAVILTFTPSIIDKGDFLPQGTTAPALVLEEGDSTIDLKSLKGRYVLVDFWSSDDAKSRLQSNEYNTLRWNKGRKSPTRISVNLDQSEKLFHEIVNRDHMDAASQFHVDGSEAGKIIKDFGLTDGCCSYLVDPQGKIAAVDPDPEYLKETLDM